jgi:hypothetical protein
MPFDISEDTASAAQAAYGGVMNLLRIAVPNLTIDRPRD